MMPKILMFLAMTLGGWIGWALGERFGMMTAMFLSLVGSAVALYAARRFTRDYFG